MSPLLTFSSLLGPQHQAAQVILHSPCFSSSPACPVTVLATSVPLLSPEALVGVLTQHSGLLGNPEGPVRPSCARVQVNLDAVPLLSEKRGHMWYSCFLKVLAEAATAQLSSPQMSRGFYWFSLTLGFHLSVVRPRCLLLVSDSLSYILRLCLFSA